MTDNAMKLQQLITDAETYDLDEDIVRAYVDNHHIEYVDDAADIADSFAGVWDHVHDYAWEFAEGVMGLDTSVFPGNYFDIDAFARDLVLGGDVWTADVAGGVAVFRNV